LRTRSDECAQRVEDCVGLLGHHRMSGAGQRDDAPVGERLQQRLRGPARRS